MGWILQLHPVPPWIEEVLENKLEDLHSESLSWLEEPWSTMGWILQLHPLPPWIEEVLENKPEGVHSESLSWLEAPWSEYYNSTHHPTAPPSMEC